MRVARESWISIPARHALALVTEVGRLGIDTAPLLAMARLAAHDLEAPRGRVSLASFSRLYSAAVLATDDEILGLLAQPVPRGAVELMCRACLTVGSMAEALDVLVRASNVGNPSLQLRWSASVDALTLHWHARAPLRGDPTLVYEISVLTVFGILTWLAGQRLPVLEASFACPKPRHLPDLRALLPGRLRFGAQESSLSLAPSLRDWPVRRELRELSRFVRQAPGSLMEAVLTPGQTGLLARHALRAGLPGACTLDLVAARLAMSPRTLHRKLALEGESFQAIKDQVRRDWAVQALTRSHSPLKQIATDLGFADQAAFQRAFAQWTGRTPGAFRQGHRGR